MKILKHPHKSLTTSCRPVEEWTSEIHQIALGMSFLIDQDPNAAAIAANQVGCDYSFFVHKSNDDHEIVINPEITYGENAKTDIEACLSFPGAFALIPRYSLVEVEYVSFPSMNIVKKVVTGFEARVFQHEIEHLEGRTMLDMMGEDERIDFTSRYLTAQRKKR